MTSNKVVETKWPSLSETKISRKTNGAQSEWHNWLLQSVSLFLQNEDSLKNEQTRGLRSIISTGASPIQQWALPAFEPPVEQDKRPKSVDHTGRTLHLGSLSWKSCAAFFFSANHKSVFH